MLLQATCFCSLYLFQGQVPEPEAESLAWDREEVLVGPARLRSALWSGSRPPIPGRLGPGFMVTGSCRNALPTGSYGCLGTVPGLLCTSSLGLLWPGPRPAAGVAAGLQRALEAEGLADQVVLLLLSYLAELSAGGKKPGKWKKQKGFALSLPRSPKPGCYPGGLHA